MKTTTWAGVRQHLKRTSLLFMLISLICIWISLKVSAELMKTRQDLIQQQTALSLVEQDLKTKQGRIDALESTIQRQDQQIRGASATITGWRQKLFNLELARDIVAYQQKGTPDIPSRWNSFNNIYLTLFYSQKYERIYKQKHPSLSQYYSWRTCMQMFWVESRLNLYCHCSASSAMGEPQILEFYQYRLKDGKVNPHAEKCLYPILCTLGYKKSTYGATIDYYWNNPEVQVDCYYYVFTQKLMGANGDFTQAVVDYHWHESDPLASNYWWLYLGARHKFNVWCDDVQTKLMSL